MLMRLPGEADFEIVGVARRTPPSAPPYDGVQWHRADLSEAAQTTYWVRQCLVSMRSFTLRVCFNPLVGLITCTAWPWVARPPCSGRRIALVSASLYTCLLSASVRPKRATHRSKSPVPIREILTSQYSRGKAVAEHLLDSYEHEHPRGMTVTRVRPGIVLQRFAGAALSRYGLPAYFPAWLLPTFGRCNHWTAALPPCGSF